MSFSLRTKDPILMDGAMGTELIARGLDVRTDIAERWVLDRPDEVSAIHRAYAAAGAQLIQTCTFGALRSRLSEALRPRVAEICARAVELARHAAPGLPIVGSLGPTGSEAEVAEAARALANAGIDALHLETHYDAEGLAVAAAGARTGAPGTPLWISVTLMTGNSGLETPHGVPVARMLRALADAAPDAVGVNCSLDADRIRGAVERLVDAGLGPVLARPQARISEKCATGQSSERPERFAERAAQLFDLGVVAVGGCCGTTPASIAALAARLSKGHRLLTVSPAREAVR
jgi:methionine synthase I (cobalamin-dependent)